MRYSGWSSPGWYFDDTAHARRGDTLTADLALLTRDGLPSVAAQLQAHALQQAETVAVTPKDLADWAEDNDVDLRVPGDKLPIVNARRVELGLPPFKLVKPAVEQTVAAARIPPIAANEAELLHLVRSFDGTKIGLLTPDCAAWLLKLNVSNRPVERVAVARFCNIIRGGMWKNTSEPIIVAREGQLNDGQHRCLAVVETGVAVEIDVRFGIARDAFMHTGTAAGRLPSQVLAIMGAQHAVPQAAVARLLFLYDRGLLGATGSKQVEPLEIVRLIRENDTILPIAAFMVGSKFAPTRTASFGFVLAAGARAASLAEVLRFGELVSSGRGDDRDASRMLHVKLRDSRMNARRLSSLEAAVLTTRAWNAWIAQRPVTALKVMTTDTTTGGFPKIRGASGS